MFKANLKSIVGANPDDDVDPSAMANSGAASQWKQPAPGGRVAFLITSHSRLQQASSGSCSGGASRFTPPKIARESPRNLPSFLLSSLTRADLQALVVFFVPICLFVVHTTMPRASLLPMCMRYFLNKILLWDLAHVYIQADYIVSHALIKLIIVMFES